MIVEVVIISIKELSEIAEKAHICFWKQQSDSVILQYTLTLRFYQIYSPTLSIFGGGY